MLSPWLLALLGLGYVGLVFAVAWAGDRMAARGRHPVPRPVVYSLSLAVYCTSWAFYGTGGQSAELGWWLPPTYVGTIVLFLFGWRFLDKVVRVGRRQRITSLADFVAARYGRDPAIGAFVTVVATLGLIPYVSLQLKAIEISFDAITGGLNGEGLLADTGLYVALALAAFAILFGTRHADATEHHPGMMLALAFESVVKLAALLAVGLFVTWGMHEGPAALAARVAADPELVALRAAPRPAGHYLALCVLGFLAIFCLPRQFHVAVVENSSPADLRLARWLFPLYLVLMGIFVLPLANAGLVAFGPTLAGADLYVLRLPMAEGQSALALFVFVGGLSAATGMVIVASVALATMISNELVMPALLRAAPRLQREGRELTPLLLGVRRTAIVLLLAAAYVYYRAIAHHGALAQIGEISMAAVAMFGPLLLASVYWRAAARDGALLGLACGTLAWTWTLLVPTLAGAGFAPAALLADGPGGLGWLRPTALFGLEGLNPLAHGLGWVLGLTTAGLVAGSLVARRSLVERIQAAVFVDTAGRPTESRYRPARHAITLRELRALAEQFVGAGRAASHFAALRGAGPAGEAARASDEQLESVQRLLGSVVGAASAQRVVDAAVSGRELELEDVVSIVGGASQAFEFSRELLQATLENVSQGVAVVDAELRLVAWNRRYLEMFGFPPAEIRVGRPIEELYRYNAARGQMGPGDRDELVARRLAHLKRGTPYVFQRLRPDGSVYEIRGQPMPGGGFVTSYSDVTEYVRAQRALEEANESLERRVQQRTRALSTLNEELLAAKAAAERANQGKTRFLAAAGHDLLQPVNAAGLLAGALAQKAADLAGLANAANADLHAPVRLLARRADEARALVGDLEQCLRAAEGVLTDLLDISRLDAGAVHPVPTDVPLDELFGALDAEFRLQARARGLELRVHRSRLAVRADPQLLRRILQNFLSNALRYTAEGGVLLGCRARGARVRIEVRDTGPGIPVEQRERIFEEFYRLRGAVGPAEPGGGFGLGLAIVERIARVLGATVGLHSVPGRGSAFWVELPRAHAAARVREPRAPTAQATPLRLLVVDNDAAALHAMRALLESWGCLVHAWDGAGATPPAHVLGSLDALIVDYHLDEGRTGLALACEVRAALGRELPAAPRREVPVVLVTADGSESVREEAAELGATLLRKPVKPLALRSVLRHVASASAAAGALGPVRAVQGSVDT